MLKKGIAIFKKQKQLQNFTIYGIGQFFNLVTPLLAVPYLVAVCNEEGYGKIGVGLAVSFFLMVFIDYGSDILGVKEVSINRNNKETLNKIFSTIYLAKLILLAVVLAVFSLIILTVPFFAREKSLFFLSFPILVGQLINPTWFLQGVENFKWITVLNITSKIIYVTGIFLFIQRPENYILNNLFWGLGMIIANSIVFFYLFKKHHFSFNATNWQEVKKYLRDNFSIFFSQIFNALQMYFPIVLVSYFGNNTMAGQYKIIDQIIVIFRTYIILFFNFIFPRVCYALNESKEEGLKIWKEANGLNFGFTTILLIIIGVLSTIIVGYFNAKDVDLVSNLLKLALIIPLLQSVSQPLKQLMFSWEKQKQYVKTVTIVTILAMAGIVFMVPDLGVSGVLYALIFSELLVVFLFFATIKNKLFHTSS
ncbi:MAG: oligosaccharide flippase family protein [Flavobacterium sp.]|uniref:oligosaccharide flippase family protein n=1 Tax=Flavobacterium sp. TaxID=239 RepID=UPI00391B87F5